MAKEKKRWHVLPYKMAGKIAEGEKVQAERFFYTHNYPNHSLLISFVFCLNKKNYIASNHVTLLCHIEFWN